jgi:hypothetical protein
MSFEAFTESYWLSGGIIIGIILYYLLDLIPWHKEKISE